MQVAPFGELVGIPARQDACPGRGAGGSGAVGALEDHAVPGHAIHTWSGNGAVAVKRQGLGEIVCYDEQDVRPSVRPVVNRRT